VLIPNSSATWARRGRVNAIEPAVRTAAGSMIAEIYLAAASSLTGMPRAFATPSP
jgi:hypothetical protein